MSVELSSQLLLTGPRPSSPAPPTSVFLGRSVVAHLRLAPVPAGMCRWGCGFGRDVPESYSAQHLNFVSLYVHIIYRLFI